MSKRTLREIDNRLERPVLSDALWGELRIFLAVAHAGSLNKAASNLNASQPTVSRAIKRLEDFTGTKLIVRSNSGARLTPDGEAMAHAAIHVDRTLHNTLANLAQKPSIASGRVRVGISEGLAGCFAATNIDAIKDTYPDIDVTFQLPLDRRSVDNNGCDVIVGFAPDRGPQSTTEPLGTLHMVAAAAPSYVDQKSLASNETHDFVQSDYFTKSDGWDDWMNVSSKGRIRYSADSMFPYGSLVLAGAGVGLVANYLCVGGRLVLIDGLKCHITRPLYLSVSQQRRTDASVIAVCDWLSLIFGPQNPWFADDLVVDCEPGPHDQGFRYLFGQD